jgi:hypothetical protein
MYMDGVVKEVNARMLGKGLELVDEFGRTYEVNQLLFADDTALVADSEEKLCRLVKEFDSVCNRRKLRVNVSKSKVMRCSRDGMVGNLNVRLNAELLEEVSCFQYLGAGVAANGELGEEVKMRVRKGYQTWGVLKAVLRNRCVGMNAKRRLYESVVVPTVMYGSETWGLRVAERRQLNVLEMKCLRSMAGVTLWDRRRNEEVRRTTGVVKELAGRVDCSVLRWFGHMERMSEERLVKKVMKSVASGRNMRGRPKVGWMDGVKVATSNRGMSVEEARRRAMDRGEWRMIVNA